MASVRAVLVSLLVLAAWVACASNSSVTPSSGPPPHGKLQKFEHIVFLIQENRTFDKSMAARIRSRTPTPPPLALCRRHARPLAKVALECTYTVRVYSCSRQDPDNYHPQWLTACDAPSPPPFTVGGPSPCRMDGFDRNQTKDLDAGQIYSYVDRAEVKPYWDAASTTMPWVTGSSWATTASRTRPISTSSPANRTTWWRSGVPPPDARGAEVLYTPWGCDSPPGTTTFSLDPTTGAESAKPTGPLPCFSYPALASLVDANKKLSWRLYAYSICQNINALNVNSSIRNSSAWPSDIEKTCPNSTPVKNNANFRAPEDTFLTDVGGNNGTLASVTWLLPGAITSDHPGVPYGYCGPWWVASVIDAIGKRSSGTRPSSSSFGTTGAATTITSPHTPCGTRRAPASASR